MIITIIFITSAVFITHYLNVIISSQELKDYQEIILDRYGNMLYALKGSQTALYKHQAGYTKDINGLVTSVVKFEDMLSLTRNEYSGFHQKAACNNCHSAQGKVDSLEKMLEQAAYHLNRYKEKISYIVTAKDLKITERLEGEAGVEGDAILEIIENTRHATAKMNERLEALIIGTVAHSRLVIFVIFIVSILLTTIVVGIIIRSVTRPVDKLVTGIEKVSAGEYNFSVDITSNDEIGFLAKSFNSMTDNINTMTRQKELLMAKLQELNLDLERRVQDATDELRLTHEKMLRTETLSVVGTFASGVAHELATPLSSIMSYFQMIRGRLIEKDGVAGDVDLIESELRRCRDILRGMLDFARAPEKEKVFVDINQIILGLLTLMSFEPKYRNIRIQKNLDEALPQIMAVPGQLKQVFMNLIVNALQAMPEGGELAISTCLGEDGKRVVVGISDTGIGLLESEINKIFQPFYTSKNSGTGLGLSISYGIVKGHGGDIEVRSEYGKGTTFDIFLPLQPDKKQLPSAEAAE